MLTTGRAFVEMARHDARTQQKKSAVNRSQDEGQGKKQSLDRALLKINENRDQVLRKVDTFQKQLDADLIKALK